MAQEITLPVKLQLENLQSIVKDMRSQLGNLKVDSSGYKKLEGVINGIEKKIQDIYVVASRPIMNEKQFAGIEKDISNIYDGLTKLGIEAGKIKFSDLKLTGDQQQHLQEFDNKLKNIREDLKHVEDRAKTAFLGTDLGKLWEQNNSKQATKSFSDITKAIEGEINKQEQAINKAKLAYENYQNIIQVSKNINSFMRGKDSLADKLQASEMLDKIFTKDRSRFKNGGRNALEDWLKQEFSLSQDAIKSITQGSGAQVLKAFTDMQDNVRSVLKSEQSRMSAARKDAINTTNNGRTLTDNIANEEAKQQTLKATQNEVVKAKEASAQAEANLRAEEEKTSAARTGFINQITDQARTELQMGKACDSAKTQLSSLNKTIDEGKTKLASLDKVSGKLQGISNFISRYVGAYAIIRKVTQAIRNAFTNIRELDKVITNIAVVTNMTQEQLWGKVGEYTKIAQEYGVMTKDVYTVSQLFYQQGLQTNQVMDLTTETLKMAKIAGMDYTAATNAMTVAVRAFNIEMSEAQQVTDTYSALAAKFAVSSAEIANAMEKTASSAANVGMSLQSTSAFMSVMIQTTRESAQNIGSALKSIISRYGEMKASPSSLINVDGEEVAFNKVDTALQSIGISIKDASGQFRDFDDVIMELAAKWDTLDNNTQRYIATVMAGNRQQSRFIALVSNYDELSRAMTTANESENASIVQVAKTMDSLESKANQLKNAWQQLYLSLNIESGMKGTYDILTRILTTIGKLGSFKGGLLSLFNLVGFGTGLKSIVNITKDWYTERKLKITTDTAQAEEELKRIQEEAEKTAVKRLEIQTNLDQVNAQLDGVMTKMMQTTMGGVNHTQAMGILKDAYQTGQLNTSEGRADVMQKLGIDSNDQQTFDNLLQQFNTLSGTAERLNIALGNATDGANNSGTAAQQQANAALVSAQAEADKSAANQQSAQSSYDAAQAASQLANKELAAAVQKGQLTQEEASSIKASLVAKQIEAKASLDLATQKSGETIDSLRGAEAAKLNADAQARNSQSSDENTRKKRENSGAISDNTNQLRANTGAQGGASKNKLSILPKQAGKYSPALMKGMGLASGVARLAGTAITAIGAQHEDRSTDQIEYSKLYTGIGNGLSMAGTGMSMGMMFGPWGAALGGLAGLLIGGVGAIIDALNHTTAEKIELAKKEAKEASDISLKAQAKTIDFKTAIDNIKNLQKTMYNSTEDMQAYKDAMNTLAEEYPELISGYDEAGNAIVNLNEAEKKLTELRRDSAQAARDAAIAELNQRKLELEGYKEIKGFLDQNMVENHIHYGATNFGESMVNSLTGNNPKESLRHDNGFISAASMDEYPLLRFMPDENGNVKAVIDSSRYVTGNGITNEGGGTVSYLEAIAHFNNTTVEKLTPEQISRTASIFAQDPTKVPRGYKTNWGSGSTSEATSSEWQWFLDTFNSPGGYEINVKDVNEELKKYKTLFGREITVGELLGKPDKETLTYEEYQEVFQRVDNKIDQQTKIIEAKLQDAGLQTATTSLYQYSGQQLSSSDQTILGDNPIYAKLYEQLLIPKKGSEYSSLYDWYTQDYEKYNAAADEAANQFFEWFKKLAPNERDFLHNIDFTQYTSVAEIAKRLHLDENDPIYQGLQQQFIDSNEANRDRILQTIYTDDENKVFNENLTGLKSLGEKQVTDIANLFKVNEKTGASEIISAYSNYFTDTLLEINDLADNGYTVMANNRLQALNTLAQKLQILEDKHQTALFGVITNIDLNDYDSLIEAENKLNDYLEDTKDLTTDEVIAIENMRDSIAMARSSLVLNVVTLSQQLTDKLKDTVKDIESILSSNKSGMSLDQALEELVTITNKFSDMSFNQLFRYDAVLRKYVYTSEGLEAAIAAREEELQKDLDKANQAAEIWNKKLVHTDIHGNQFSAVKLAGSLTGNISGNKETVWQILSDAISWRYGEEWGIYGNYFQNILYEYLETDKDATHSWEEFEAFLIEKAKNNTEAAKKYQEMLDTYRAEENNIIYGNIDWASIALGTDYTGTNRQAMIDLALRMGMDGQKTWEEISNKYLEGLYKDNPEGLAAAQAARDSTIYQEHASNLTTAIGEVLNGSVNKYYSVATQQMLKDGGYATDTLKDDLEHSVGAATSFLRNMEDLIGTGAVTLEQYNEQAKLILDKVLGSYSKGKLGLDFMSGTIDSGALQNLANTLGIELTDIVDVTSGQIKGKLGSLVRYNALTGTYDIIAKSFDEFRLALQEQFGIIIQKDSKEYIAALKTYNDNRLKAETEYQDNVLEELNKLPQAKNGDRLNLAYIYSILGDQAAELFAGYGEFTEDGILTITDAAKLPEIINGITGELQKAGALLPEEIAKLNDTLLSYFQNISNLIKNGIGGSLSYQNKADLEAWAKSVNPDLQLDFTRTANGFKLSQKSAEALYDELVKIDSISAGIVLEELNKSIEDSITSTKKLKREVQELRAVTESDDFKFMDHDIPSGQNNPLNYYSNWSEAFKVIRESGAAGPDRNMMAYEDFFNLITEMGYLADRSGEIVVSGDVVLKNSQDASDLIEKAAAALEFTSDGSVKINLAQIGIDFSTGAKDLKTSVGKGMKDVAKSQIEILDSMIKFLEPLAAMEDLKDIAGEDGIFDITDIFETDIVGSGFNEKFNDQKAQILKAAEQNEDLLYGLNNTMIGEKSLYKILASNGKDLNEEERKALQAYLNASQSPDFDPSNPNSWQQVLAGMGVDAEFIREDQSKIIIRKGTVIEADPHGNYLYNGHQFKNEEAAIKAAHADNIVALQGIVDKDYNAETGEVAYTLDNNLTITTRYVEDGGELYIAEFGDGDSVKAATPEALSAGIRHYMQENYSQIDLNSEGDNTTNSTLDYTMTLSGKGEYRIQLDTKNQKVFINDKEASEGDFLQASGISTIEKYYGVDIPAEVNTTVNLDAERATKAAQIYRDILKSIPPIIPTTLALFTKNMSSIDGLFSGTAQTFGNAFQWKNSEQQMQNTDQLQLDKANIENANIANEKSSALEEVLQIEKENFQQMKSDQHEEQILFDSQKLDKAIINGKDELLENISQTVKDKKNTNTKDQSVRTIFQPSDSNALVQRRVDEEGNEYYISNIVDRAKIGAYTDIIHQNELGQFFSVLEDGTKILANSMEELQLGLIHARLENGTITLEDIQSLNFEFPESIYDGSDFGEMSYSIQHGEDSTAQEFTYFLYNSHLSGLGWTDDITESQDEILQNLSILVADKLNQESEIKIAANSEEAEKTIDDLQEHASEPVSFNLDTSDAIGNIEYVKALLASLAASAAATLTLGLSNVSNILSSKPGSNPQSSTTGPAHAQGTLMGELGPELVVSNGRYFVAGQNGAEFVDLDTDAIVFNHLQTKSLLSKGVSSSRGKAVTSEKNAVAFAHGNVNGGPAQASARQTLNALKQLRAQWEAIAKMDAASLANLGGSGSGGGGDKSDPKAFVKELEIWYNWLQRIAVLEQKITYEQQKRQKIQSDMYAHGQDYARSNMETLAYLREQAVVSKSLYDSQQAYFEKRRAEMNAASNPFSALYTFDEYGQLKYQNGAFQQLANISSRDKLTGQGNYTAADQYAKLVAMGFEKYMQYDSSGNKIDTSQEDWQVTAVQAFWDKMDADKEEMQSLHDSIEEHKKAVLEKQEAANQIMREIEDNQISVEDKVLKAIIDTRQREIDELQKQRDAIEEASKNLIDGLSEQLNKEKEMYSSQQNQDELSKLQRQLGILQRSGGSASQIANLQREIGQKQQDAYFEAQQKQIDALQEASDNELQRLDNQIELMKETLEYEKENGLLWGQVYEVMAGTPEQITAFIMEHDSEFWGQSPTKDTQTYRETLFEAQQFKEYQAQMKDGFDGLVAAFKDEAIAKAAREEAAKANANTSNGEGVNTGGGSAPSPSGGETGGNGNAGNSGKGTSANTAQNATKHGFEFYWDGAKYENSSKASKAEAEASANSLINNLYNNKRQAMQKKGLNVRTAEAEAKVYKEDAKKSLKTYDIGGMVDSTGPALLHAKESVLTPEQTSILRNDILSNKPTSLLSLLTDFRDAYNSIPNASDYNSITNNDGVTIEQAIVEMHVSKIANDYDAQRAGENALEKMVQIARKTQGQRIGR